MRKSILRHVLVTVALLTLPQFALAQSWWNCDWEHRFTATAVKGAGPAPVNYQVRLDLDASNVPAEFDWSRQGDDLRIIDQDDTTELDFFIGSWDVAGQAATLWVTFPVVPGGAGRSVYIYFLGPAGSPPVSSPDIFTEPGLKIHTKRSAANPTDLASAEAAFAAGNGNAGGYGCTFIDNYTGITNRSLFAPPNRNGDFGLLAEVFFEVTAAEAGIWQFRYGADFGRGGGLYVDGVALEERWNDDLWWANNWNSGDVLQGSINLSEGTHSILILGFEGCCDGGLTAQFMRPGGTWQALALANIDLSSRACAANDAVVTYGPVEARSCPIVDLTRSTQTFSDPFNNTTNPYAIPGATIQNTTTISNSGDGAVDADSIEISEQIAANVALRVSGFGGGGSPVQFSDGSPASGLSFVFVSLGDPGDDVDFSNDGGATFTYTPVPDATGVDVSVTDLRITPTGALQGDSGAGAPNASFDFMTVVQ